MLVSGEVENSFLEAMAALGVQPHGNKGLEADDKIHRYRVEGDKSGSENGWYVLYVDGAVPAGAFGSWKTGESTTWCAKSEHALSPFEREEWRRRQLEARQARDAELKIVREKSRKKAERLWGIARPASEGMHPYLLAKGVKSYGLKMLKNSLLVPLWNASGAMTSLQFIQADGGKKFLTGGEISGSYYAIGRPCHTVLICEGYATGASLYQATGFAVAVAFNAGNLLPVAKVMREKFPDFTIIVCADNDVERDSNIGLRKAEEAAVQIGGMLAAAKFQDHDNLNGKIPTDFNDMHQLHGLEAVRSAINQAAEVELKKSAKLTIKDFEILIDDAADFEFLTDDLVMKIAAAGLKRPAVEYLISKIAKKAGVPKQSLLDEMNAGGDGDKRRINNDDNGRIDELNMKHAILPFGGRVLVMNREFDPVMNRQLLTFSAKADFEMRYCNRKVFDRGDEIGLGTFWLNHPRRAEFDGMVFSPGQDQPGYLNLWTGWGSEPKAGCCKSFLEFVMDVICSGKAELFDYIIYWCAHLVQRPQELPETALVFRGREGIGKNTFVDILRDIVGREHYLMLSSLAQITGRFSGHLATALLIFCNESVWGGDKSAQGVLKSMITDDMQPIEYKGRDLFMVKSYRRLIFGTNENWAVPRGADDRRYVVSDVSDEHKGDYRYFNTIRQEMKSGGTAAFMDYLLKFDIDGWHPRDIPDQLKFKGWELKIRSGGSIVQWWYWTLLQGWLEKLDNYYSEGEELIWPERCLVETMQHSYLSYCLNYRITHPEHVVALGKQLHDWGIRTSRPRTNNPNRKIWYLLPSLEQAQEIFSARFSIPPSAWECHDKGEAFM